MIDFLFGLRHFAAILTGLLFLGAATPIVSARTENARRRLLASNASLFLITIASAYAMVFGAYLLLTHSIAFSHASWLQAIGATVTPARLSASPPEMPSLPFELQADALSSYFLILIGFIGLLVAVYSFDALRASHYQTYRHYIAGAFSLFLWGSLMTVIVGDVFSLLLTLELTSLAFATLTLFKTNVYRLGQLQGDAIQKKEARLAPKVYLIISHASTVFLILGFLLLAVPAGSFKYSALFAHRSALSSFRNTTSFLLLFTGLGIRVGLTPFHFWPPLVHPASPTTTHAFSLGIGIKVAIFLMIRIFFQFLNIQPWWGLLVFSVAGVTVLFNVWYAIASHDLKTALAYHSIENIGIILAGVGLAMYGIAHQSSAVAGLGAVGMMAGLFHLFNHAIFKSLLYLATGAIENLTHGEVHMQRLGGLIRFYPLTGAMFLVGAFAISGFPPFNGFISEWLLIKTNLGMFSQYAFSGNHHEIFWREIAILLLGFGLLVSSFALTAFCFFKIAGLTLFGDREYLGDRWEKEDVKWQMAAPMVFLGAISLAVGLFPQIALIPLSSVVDSLGFPNVPRPPLFPVSLELADAPFPRFLFIVGALMIFIIILPPFIGTLHRLRKGDFWQGGVSDLPKGYVNDTSASLSQLIRHQLRYLSPSSPQEFRRPPDYLPDIFILSESSRPEARQTIFEIFRFIDNWLIDSTFNLSRRFAETVQNGDIRRYMGYILVIYLGLLALFIFLSDLLNLASPR